MKSGHFVAWALALLGVVALGSGCETTGESAGLGAVIGAGVGAIIGAQSGEAAAGALIGAAVGGAGGAIGHDVRETRAEKRASAAETMETYHYQPSQGESMVFEDGSVVPSAARRGTMVEASMQYALLGSGSGQQVTETRIVKRNGEVVSQISQKSFTRNDGTWVSLQKFRVPENWTPGEYTLEQVVETARSKVSGTARFYVN